ncbi:hypothetical protein GKE82_05500 [Conexibacter sp. W3-3-2]|uniref:ArdC-like ssDNA-binding domain-containing protein n=1 Tax=Conexibacter sp. W3-3-2 TaxID=2675227 RepID=UPI0012B6B35D|nr:ArdC-like ssDNA-binding domain-containing protein [Conexibacter sp. W3-3-2]MTD43774.1 hypothetical protein [Conexibacter sp. W3-3-2]
MSTSTKKGPSKETEEQRQARREADRQRAQEAVEALRSSEGWQRWLGLRRHFHRYSLSNQILIAFQMPEASRVAGFRAWLRLGYCVAKGERAIRVWVPMPPAKAQIAEWLEAGGAANDKPRVRFRLGPVFDRSQVTPLPPPAEPVPLDPPIIEPEGDSLGWAFPRLCALAGELGCGVVIERMPDGTGGCFMPELRVISLNEANSVNHQVKTMIHELGHALMRWSIEKGEVELTYSQEELVVESVAYTVCGSIGLDTSDYSIPYLTSWSERTPMEVVERCAAWVDQIAKRIEDCVGDPPGAPLVAAA